VACAALVVYEYCEDYFAIGSSSDNISDSVLQLDNEVGIFTGVQDTFVDGRNLG